MTPETLRSAAGSDGGEAASAALAATVLSQAPMFIGLCDAQLRPVFLNAAGQKMIGLSATVDITTYRITDFFTPQDRQVLEETGLPTMLREGQREKDLYFRHLIDPARQAAVRWSRFALGGPLDLAVRPSPSKTLMTSSGRRNGS